VLEKTADGFEILGKPEGIEHLGGIDFDEAVFQHVRASLDSALDELDPTDSAALVAVARLRQECVESKEALSSEADTVIPVLLPNRQTEVRLTRPQFEGMVRAPILETVAAFRRALQSAAVDAAQLKAVLLVGGSSRVPLVGELISAEFGRPVAVDAHPKHAIALGAALVAARAATGKPHEAIGVLQPGEWYLAGEEADDWVYAVDQNGVEGWVARAAVRRYDS
jgi:molecular chaperone DnaK (HSP70)